MQIPSLNARNGFMCNIIFLLPTILLYLGYAALYTPFTWILRLHALDSIDIPCKIICFPQLSVTMGNMSKFDRYNAAQKTKKKHLHKTWDVIYMVQNFSMSLNL